MVNLIKPSIHLNGSSAARLRDDYIEAISAVQTAIDKLTEAAPHGRDYYVQEGNAFLIARTQHHSRVQRLKEVEKELEYLAQHCADAADKR